MSNDHIFNVTSKAAKRLYLLLPKDCSQLKRAGICASDLVLFYCSTIRSVLEYACQVFHSSLPYYLSEELERIQKRAFRSYYLSFYDRQASLSSDLFNDIVFDINPSSQVCSHLKLSTIGSCAAIESLTCQCARLIVLKNLLLLAIA